MSSIRLSPAVEAVVAEVVATRRDIHAHPERGFQERRTARLVADRLRALGIAVREGVAETGVIGLIEGGQPGPTVMLRADMDALPIQEENDVPYASQTPGVMHACGHDAHTAILLGAARVLAGERERLQGNVKLVFQPAEESYGGARRMVEEGVLHDPEVSSAFALHVWNTLPLGTVGIVQGVAMAATDTFVITIRGSGGHAAAPHHTVDPVVTAAHFLVAVQSVVSRNTDPLQPVVFSIGSIHGGAEAPNIIPDEVILRGTLRTLDARLRSRLPGRIREVLAGVTDAFGATYTVNHRPGYPRVMNDPELGALAREEAARVVGAENVSAPSPSMGGEDMAYYLEQVPGCYLWLGSANAEKGLAQPHHCSRFNLDERALGIGVELMVRLARRQLG